MSALCLYVCGLIVVTPLQGGGEHFRFASLAICHPPDQNAETASAPVTSGSRVTGCTNFVN